MHRLLQNLALALLIVGLASFCFGASDKAKSSAKTDGLPTGEVTHLDALVVTANQELPPPERWSYVRLPAIDVFSSASERAAKKLLEDFERFRTGLDYAFPIHIEHKQPCTLVLCGRNRFAQFLPKKQSQIAGASSDSGRASITLIGRERAYLVVDLGTPTLALNGAEMDLDIGSGPIEFEVDYFQLLFREYVHYLLSQLPVRPPVWYEEGLLQIIQKMEVADKEIIIGDIKSQGARTSQAGDVMKAALGGTTSSASGVGDNDASSALDDNGALGIAVSETVEDGDFNVALRRQRLLDFKVFFGVTRDSPLANNPISNNVWAKQCYAFVHMCFYQKPNRYRHALETLVARLAKEPMSEQLFTECFGKPYKKVLMEMRGYIDFTTYEYQMFATKGKDRITVTVPELTEATEGEGARMKGDVLLVAGNPEAAVQALRGAYGRGERGADFLTTYGLVARASHQDDLARRFLSKAVAGKTSRAAAYAAYAGILLDDAKAKPEAEDKTHISIGQLATVLDPLFNARKMTPPLRETYETIADAWLQSAVPPKREQFAAVAEGVMLFPYDTDLIYRAAKLACRMNDVHAASALVAYGRKNARTDAAREKFDELATQLPKESSAPSETASPVKNGTMGAGAGASSGSAAGTR